MTTPKISVLLPTRKRTELVTKSISSLLANAANPENIEILIAYDEDDEESREYFSTIWYPFIEQTGAQTSVFETERFGYLRLYRYVNFLGEQAKGDWIMFWNDDALMLTENWDTEIVKNNDWFGLLRMPCVTMNHPFALFPIIPKSWIDFFGKISPVNHSDWWIYNVCAPLQRVKNIPVEVYHDRADVTGHNNDQTFQEQSYAADGKDPTNPEDYAHPERQQDLSNWIQKFLTKIRHEQ